jgi:hypothetical protein
MDHKQIKEEILKELQERISPVLSLQGAYLDSDWFSDALEKYAKAYTEFVLHEAYPEEACDWIEPAHVFHNRILKAMEEIDKKSLK